MREFFTHTYDLLVKGGAALAGFLYGAMKGEGRSALFLVILMAADYCSGLVAAAMGKSPNSRHGRLCSAAGGKGLLKKAVILLVVGLAFALDWFINDGNHMFQTAVIWFYISNESLSLMENLGRCGVPIPKKLQEMLESLRNQQQDEDESPPQNG